MTATPRQVRICLLVFEIFEMMQFIYSIQIKGVYIWKWTILRGLNFSNRWYEHYPKMLSNSILRKLDRIRREIISRQNPFTLNKVRLRWAKNEIPDQNLKNKLWPQLFIFGNVTVSIGQVSVELTLEFNWPRNLQCTISTCTNTNCW